MPETTVLKVLLHCDGCVSKVKRHIRRLEGVESFHVDPKNSKVTVIGTVKPQVVLDKVLRAGKLAELWPQSVDEVVKAEVPDTLTAASAQVRAALEVGKKKKKAASGNAGGKAMRKLKNWTKGEQEEEIELEDVGDGEIVDVGDDESDERMLIKCKKPRKNLRIFTRG